MITPNTPLPDFSLPDQDGVVRGRDEFLGRWLVLYFYPRDNTPGCTLEARDFAARLQAFEKAGAVVLGISADSVASHSKFAAKLCLPFPILSDVDHAFSEACGVWQKKKMAGREYMGIVRTTLLVDPKGRVRQIWSPVKVDKHADLVLDALAGLAQ